MILVIGFNVDIQYDSFYFFSSSRTMNIGGDLLEKPTTEVEDSGSYWPGNPALPPPPAPRNTFLNSRVRSLMSLSLSLSFSLSFFLSYFKKKIPNLIDLETPHYHHHQHLVTLFLIVKCEVWCHSHFLIQFSLQHHHHCLLTKRNYLNRGDVAAACLPLQNLLVLDRQGLGKGKRYNIFSSHSNFMHKHCWGLIWMEFAEFEKSSCILLPWNFKNEDKSSGACSCRVISLRRMVQHRGWERLNLEWFSLA